MSLEKPRHRLRCWGFSSEILLITWILIGWAVRGGKGCHEPVTGRFRPDGASSVAFGHAPHAQRPERTVCLDTFANLFRIKSAVETFGPDCFETRNERPVSPAFRWYTAWIMFNQLAAITFKRRDLEERIVHHATSVLGSVRWLER
mgnify:CR=1 FL=1